MNATSAEDTVPAVPTVTILNCVGETISETLYADNKLEAPEKMAHCPSTAPLADAVVTVRVLVPVMLVTEALASTPIASSSITEGLSSVSSEPSSHFAPSMSPWKNVRLSISAVKIFAGTFSTCRESYQIEPFTSATPGSLSSTLAPPEGITMLSFRIVARLGLVPSFFSPSS